MLDPYMSMWESRECKEPQADGTHLCLGLSQLESFYSPGRTAICRISSAGKREGGMNAILSNHALHQPTEVGTCRHNVCISTPFAPCGEYCFSSPSVLWNLIGSDSWGSHHLHDQVSLLNQANGLSSNQASWQQAEGSISSQWRWQEICIVKPTCSGCGGSHLAARCCEQFVGQRRLVKRGHGRFSCTAKGKNHSESQ